MLDAVVVDTFLLDKISEVDTLRPSDRVVASFCTTAGFGESARVAGTFSFAWRADRTVASAASLGWSRSAAASVIIAKFCSTPYLQAVFWQAKPHLLTLPEVQMMQSGSQS